MTGNEADAFLEGEPLLGFERPQCRKRYRHQGRLSIFSEGELILWPLPHHLGQRLAERLVDFGKHGTRRRVSLGEPGAHADRLAPLPGKSEGNAHLVDWISAAKVGPETLFASGLSSKAAAGGGGGTKVGRP